MRYSTVFLQPMTPKELKLVKTNVFLQSISEGALHSGAFGSSCGQRARY
ncbi:hypothetical protein [Paenibacillus sp. J2TS4]|nr:hypothetical protein [Paenibacillus sp. J2TS4]